jgi:Tfp pilus assembly protein PilE
MACDPVSPQRMWTGGWNKMSVRQNIRDHEPGANRARVDRGRYAPGLTLVEVMMAAIILVVAAMGTLRCQYYAATHGRIARAQTVAARIAQLLLEDWKSTGGSTEYDPTGLDLGFSEPRTIPSGFTTAEGLGSALNNAVYAITLDKAPILVMLKYSDVVRDGHAEATLRQLSVVIRFGGTDGKSDQHDADNRLADMPPMTLVTYTRIDASNG